MRTDPRIAEFGGSHTEASLGSVEREAHWRHARLYAYAVNAAAVMTINLPSQNVRTGFLFAIWNRGAGGTGTISLVDPSLLILTFRGPSGGTEELAPGTVAFVYAISPTAFEAWAYPAQAGRTIL